MSPNDPEVPPPAGDPVDGVPPDPPAPPAPAPPADAPPPSAPPVAGPPPAATAPPPVPTAPAAPYGTPPPPAPLGAQPLASAPYGTTPPPGPYGVQPPGVLPYPGAAPVGVNKGLGTGAIIGIVAGALVLLLVLVVGGIVAIAAFSGGNRTQDAAGAVERYFTALSEGDAAAALALVETYGDTSLLTDEVLAVSLETAPIADIEVTPPAEADGWADVSVSYTIGGEPVTTSVSVVDVEDDGTWTVDGLATLSISSSALAGLALDVNGVPADGTEFDVFPGDYTLSTTTEHLMITGGTTQRAPQPWDYVDYYDVMPALTEDGVVVFRQAVTDSLNACLAETTIAAGCGLGFEDGFSDGTVLVEGSVVRTLDEAGRTALATYAPDEDQYEGASIRGGYIGSVSFTAQCTQGDRSGSCTLWGPTLGRPVVDFSTSPVSVRWE